MREAFEWNVSGIGQKWCEKQKNLTGGFSEDTKVFDQVRKRERQSRILTYSSGVYFIVFPDYERKKEPLKHSDCSLFLSLKYFFPMDVLGSAWSFCIHYQWFMIVFAARSLFLWRKKKKAERITIPPKNVTIWPVSDTTWVR